MAEAIRRADELGHRAMLWRIHADYADVLEARGEVEAAAESRRQARAIMRQIVDLIENENLREPFMAAQQVQRILGGD